ncbi:MAG: MarR family winged helix-turn-helix transcriptional regulator [Microbacterium sp.]
MSDPAEDDTSAEDLDAIAGALSRLRGRGPGPRGERGERGEGGGRGHGPHGHGHPGREWMHGERGTGGDDEADGVFGPGGRFGRGAPGPWSAGPWAAGPWAAGARMGGPARLRMLEALAAASHPLSVSEVGDATGVDQPRASRLIQQAVDLGFVRREADPDDARRTRIALTDEGAKVVRGFRGQRREHLSQALEGFTPEERSELARLLTKLAAAWPQH